MWKACPPFIPLLSMATDLPLGLLSREEFLEDFDNLLQSFEVLLQLGPNGLLGAELGVKDRAVRAGAHSGTEKGLDQEAVMGLESEPVGVAEGIGEFLLGVGDIFGKALAGELQPSVCDCPCQ